MEKIFLVDIRDKAGREESKLNVVCRLNRTVKGGGRAREEPWTKGGSLGQETKMADIT